MIDIKKSMKSLLNFLLLKTHCILRFKKKIKLQKQLFSNFVERQVLGAAGLTRFGI
jgi:hypothetical protein